MSIADTLSDAAREIREYLNEPVYADVYTVETRERIEKLVVEMDYVRRLLDAGNATFEHRRMLVRWPDGRLTVQFDPDDQQTHSPNTSISADEVRQTDVIMVVSYDKPLGQS
jgi:hypothetical protein